MLERLGQRLSGSILFWDLIVTLLALALSSYLRLVIEFGKNVGLENVQLPWQIYIAVWALWSVVFLLFRPQHAIFSRSLTEALWRLFAAVGLSSLAFAGLLYLTFREVSRLHFLYFVGIDLLALLVLHLLIRAYSHHRQHTGNEGNILIVGNTPSAHQLALELQRRPWAGLRIVGYTSDEQTPADLSGAPWLGSIDDTIDVVQQHTVHEIVFALPPEQNQRIARLSLHLQRQPVMLHMIPGVLDLAFARTSALDLGGIPLISLRESALNDVQRMVKRLFDITVSASLLLLLSPLLLLLAVLIKLESRGSIFFLQERLGENGRRFRMIKFRSMYQDAEQRWQEVAQRDAAGNLIHKRSDDPRITRIGRIIRRTSLVELPQLINVLRGEMSLVGPRPEMPYIAEEYEPWQWQRFRVPPGMTGWWQVNGRSTKPMHLNTEEDLYYIQNYSFWLDLLIIFKTVGAVVRGQGAY